LRLLLVLAVSTLETPTPCCYCGCCTFLYFSSRSTFPPKFAIFSNWKQARSNAQNGLSSWSMFDIVFFDNLAEGQRVTEITLKHCSAADVAYSVANPGPADTWEWSTFRRHVACPLLSHIYFMTYFRAPISSIV